MEGPIGGMEIETRPTRRLNPDEVGGSGSASWVWTICTRAAVA